MEGHFSSATGTTLNLYCTYSTSQDIANNRTAITINAYITHGSITAAAQTSSTITCNGEEYKYTSPKVTTSNASPTLIGSHTFYVTHDSNGNKTGVVLEAGWSFYGTYSSTYIRRITASTTIDLPKIDVKPTITLNKTSVDVGGSITITISGGSSSFTHTITAYFAGKWADESNRRTTTVYGNNSGSLTIPTSWYSYMQSSTSGTAYVWVETKMNGSTIYTAQPAFTVNVPSSIKPTVGTISLTPESITLKNNTSLSLLVNKRNKLTIGVSGCSAGSGSKITSYSFSGTGISSTISSDNKTSCSTSISSVSASGFSSGKATLTYTITVKDARGRSATATKTIDCYEYASPTISNFKVYRCDSNKTSNANGTYINCTYTTLYSSVNSKNSLYSQLLYIDGVSRNYTSDTVISLENTKTHSVYLVITDQLNGSQQSNAITVYGESRILNIKSGGTGIAIGKMAEIDNLVESKYKIQADAGIKLKGNSSYLTFEDGGKGRSSTYFYSGDSNSKTIMGLWDSKISSAILQYKHGETNEDNKVLKLSAPNGTYIYNGLTAYNGTTLSGGATISGTATFSNAATSGSAITVDSGRVTFNNCGKSSSDTLYFWTGNSSSDIVFSLYDNSTSKYPFRYMKTDSAQIFEVQPPIYFKTTGFYTYGNETYGKIYINSTSGNMQPSTSGNYSLGASSYRFYKLWASQASDTSSDRNYKDNIEDINIDIIDGLRPVQYNLKYARDEDKNKTHYGFIAQEVEEILEDANIDIESSGIISFVINEETGERENYSLVYEEFIPMLTKKCQSLQSEVNELKSELEELKSVILALNNSMKSE